ncbi:uncharacterized protein [Littorina saxatilis]|uniref:Uncharacterized protein n=1 Tax=Littorina saxatilis TaxID=31220 RepID=A0AAN9ALF4_9CAEN
MVDRGTNLGATCAWEKGHPNLLKPDDVTLMDARGDPLNPVWTGDNNISAAFRVDCERSGTITCYVPGASKNMTAGLQVTGCGGTTEPNNITKQNYGNTTPTDNSAVLIGGTTGAAAFLVIVVLSAFVLKKIWGKRTQLPPPPAPCTMRHRATDSALFRRNIPQQPQDRDTFGSDHTHFYFDIDDLETGTANSSQVSSDSTLNCQFLDFIACPSSDSSRSEIEFEAKDCESEDIATLDSLRCATSHPIPADPKQEVSVPSCTDETATLPGETAKEGMTASRSSPSGMKPSPCPMVQGKPTPDDYLHPTASQSNAGTVPSERVASETSATLTTVSKETKKPPRLPSDYLHPIASPFEGNTAF